MKSTPGTLAAPPLRRPRRLRSDARLARLTPAQRDRLHTWLDRENRPYVAVVQLIREEFGLTTSKSALGVYYRRVILPEHSDADPELAACLAALKAGHRDPYTLHRAQVHAYLALARPDPQIPIAEKLLHYLHRAKKQDLARQRLALKQERAALQAAQRAARLPSSPPPPNCPQSPISELRSPIPPPRFPAYSTLVPLPLLAEAAAKADTPAPPPTARPPTPPAFIISISTSTLPTLAPISLPPSVSPSQPSPRPPAHHLPRFPAYSSFVQSPHPSVPRPQTPSASPPSPSVSIRAICG